MRSPELEEFFPNLQLSGYEIKSEQDCSYNCIAWAARDTFRGLWWPRPDVGYYWPRDPRSESVEEFVEVFQSMGYSICDSSDSETGYEKVAIYADIAGNPTHMARQHSSGLWWSKCGDLEDILHRLEGLEDSDYGKVRVIMKRPVGKSLRDESWAPQQVEI